MSNQDRDIGAAILSLFIPGLGQMVQGKVAKGVLWLVGTCLAYLLFIPGLVVHILCVLNAAKNN
jgi:TM2 domain-containing membrane protein YozV